MASRFCTGPGIPQIFCSPIWDAGGEEISARASSAEGPIRISMASATTMRPATCSSMQVCGTPSTPASESTPMGRTCSTAFMKRLSGILPWGSTSEPGCSFGLAVSRLAFPAMGPRLAARGAIAVRRVDGHGGGRVHAEILAARRHQFIEIAAFEYLLLAQNAGDQSDLREVLHGFHLHVSR